MLSGATPLSMISLSACVAAMVCRAAHHGLNDTSLKTVRVAEPIGQRRDIGRHVVDAGQKAAFERD